jgi:hypothetical protein
MNTTEKNCNCSSCPGTQYRNFEQTWKYPDGSLDTSNWNYFQHVGYNTTKPDVQAPMRYPTQENFCNSCNSTSFLNSSKTWTYQKPYSS